MAYLTGIMGVRTKFQTFQTPQLILKAHSSSTKSKESGVEVPDGTQAPKIPVEITTEDDVLLSRPKLTVQIQDSQTMEENSTISLIDQAIVLALW